MDDDGTAPADGSPAMPQTAFVPGGPVSLLPVHGGRLVHGAVEVAGGGRPRVRLDGGPGSLLRDAGVWVLSRAADEGLRVHEATVRAVEGDRTVVDLTDVRLLADEQRRAHLRAAAQAPVLLVEPGRRSRGTTVDLSAGGCRVTLAYGQSLRAGQVLQVGLDIDQGSTVWADSEVVRVDDARHEAALRFIRLEPGDCERVERRLLRGLTRTGA